MILCVLLNVCRGKSLIVRKSGGTITRQPHEVNILLQGLFYFATRIDIVQVCIKQNFEHHTGMVAAGTSSFICPEQTTNIQGVYNTVYNTNVDDWELSFPIS